ncbi:MAG TPA: threonine synthase [Vicinamibacterales bacterium]|nr:threonine synthase [Vicinamibacterales bacterium]
MALSHLECSVPCGAAPLDPRGRHHLCRCGAPLLARYDLSRVDAGTRDRLAARGATMWRYRELLPLFDGEDPVTLGEGWTPLLAAPRLGAALGLDRLYVKDESLNPTHSFKARGLSAAVTRARLAGATVLSIPSAGNAGDALAAYAARAGLEAKVFMPRDAQPAFVRECELYGAEVTLVDGLITDAGRVAAERGASRGWYDVSTLREPYRVEGKKTMGFEIVEQLGWRYPDWIVYPTGGGTGIVGMWKAFDELEQLGWVSGRRPRLVSVQAAGCAPIVRAFEAGALRADPWERAATVADGLRVPRAIGDFLILRALRASGGTAVAIDDADMVAAARELGALEGISASPEGGAAVAAVRLLANRGLIARAETVVLFNTGGALKYLDVLGPAAGAARP